MNAFFDESSPDLITTFDKIHLYNNVKRLNYNFLKKNKNNTQNKI